MEEKDLLDIIQKLRAKGKEQKTLDAKQQLTLTENGEKAEFVKDIVAMANNVEKSHLVIGLIDGSFADLGTLPSHHQKSNLNQFLADKIDPPITIDYQEFTVSGNEYGLIEIIGYNPPYIVARDLIANKTDKKQIKIYQGTIFVRREDTTEGITRTELEELLEKRRIRQEFNSETAYAQQLVFERPYAWEYKLTAELLQSNLISLKQRYAELQRGLVYKRSTRIQGAEFIHWIQAKCDDISNIIKVLAVVVNEEISSSWGLPGVSGNPLEIKQAVDKLISICSELVEWETDIRFSSVPSLGEGFRQKMEGWTRQAFDEVCSAPHKLLELFTQPDPKGTYNIPLIFKEPPGLSDALAELERIKNNPQILISLISGF